MIASVMGMRDMLEIFFFKECLRAWVKSCDKFENMKLFEHPSYSTCPTLPKKHSHMNRFIYTYLTYMSVCARCLSVKS